MTSISSESVAASHAFVIQCDVYEPTSATEEAFMCKWLSRVRGVICFLVGLPWCVAKSVGLPCLAGFGNPRLPDG